MATASLRLGEWERADCSTTRMGFGCEVPRNSPSFYTSLLHHKAVEPIWMQSENAQGQVCYLGTCYTIRDNISNGGNYESSKYACGDQQVALPRNPVELAFIRTLLQQKTNATQAWIGIEVTHSNDRLEFPRSSAITPWLTAAIHKSQPVILNTHPTNESEKICFLLDTATNSTNPPFHIGPCYEDEEDSWEEDEEEDYYEMEEDEYNHKVAAFCTTPVISTAGVCPENSGNDQVGEWHEYGNNCYAVMKDCSGDSVPAILKTPDINTFITWMLSSSKKTGKCETIIYLCKFKKLNFHCPL